MNCISTGICSLVSALQWKFVPQKLAETLQLDWLLYLNSYLWNFNCTRTTHCWWVLQAFGRKFHQIPLIKDIMQATCQVYTHVSDIQCFSETYLLPCTVQRLHSTVNYYKMSGQVFESFKDNAWCSAFDEDLPSLKCFTFMSRFSQSFAVCCILLHHFIICISHSMLCCLMKNVTLCSLVHEITSDSRKKKWTFTFWSRKWGALNIPGSICKLKLKIIFKFVSRLNHMTYGQLPTIEGK